MVLQLAAGRRTVQPLMADGVDRVPAISRSHAAR
jgi:hypothetical protein